MIKNKNRLLKVVNPVIFLLLIFQIARVPLLMLSGYAEWSYLLHKLNGYLLGIFVLIHIILNFQWIKNQFLK